MPKRGTAQETVHPPSIDLALSAKVTTGGLSTPSPDGRWGATSYGLMGPRASRLHFLTSMLMSFRVAMMVEKQKVIFLLDSGACLSVLQFCTGPQSNDKVIIQGISGKHLELYFTQPLYCSWRYLHFCRSFLIVSRSPAGIGFTMSTKISNSPPPRQLSLLAPPSATNRSHSVD
jgi:hypothetical protein